MSYHDDEDNYKSSEKATGLLLKAAFNIAIIIVLYKLLYYPDFPETLRNSGYLYIMPIVGIIGTFFYLTYWFGMKNSLYITGILGSFILLLALTSADILFAIYGLGIIASLAYGIYLLTTLVVKKR